MIQNLNVIEYLETEDGDWEEIILNGKTFASNHSLRANDWINLIEKITGIQVIKRVISED